MGRPSGRLFFVKPDNEVRTVVRTVFVKTPSASPRADGADGAEAQCFAGTVEVFGQEVRVSLCDPRGRVPQNEPVQGY